MLVHTFSRPCVARRSPSLLLSARTLCSAVGAKRPSQLATQPTIWDGLVNWRRDHASSLKRHWAAEGLTADGTPLDEEQQRYAGQLISKQCRDLTDAAVLSLRAADPLEKTAITHAAWLGARSGTLAAAGLAPDEHRARSKLDETVLDSLPGRPALPKLVNPREIPPAKQSDLPLAVYMLHNLAHVELNAIDLAWDTVARFSRHGLPTQFALDFAKYEPACMQGQEESHQEGVADDESRHLLWCLQRLRELGYDYGCMPAHSLLWEGAQLSKDSLSDRLAIVPMSQEARGLDAGPRLVRRLVGLGDHWSAEIVGRIAHEESAHVAVGVAWFRALCHAQGKEPGACFRGTLRVLCPDLLKPPFEVASREAVGLPQQWFDPTMWDAEEENAPQMNGSNCTLFNTTETTDVLPASYGSDLAMRMVEFLAREISASPVQQQSG